MSRSSEALVAASLGAVMLYNCRNEFDDFSGRSNYFGVKSNYPNMGQINKVKKNKQKRKRRK